MMSHTLPLLDVTWKVAAKGSVSSDAQMILSELEASCTRVHTYPVYWAFVVGEASECAKIDNTHSHVTERGMLKMVIELFSVCAEMPGVLQKMRETHINEAEKQFYDSFIITETLKRLLIADTTETELTTKTPQPRTKEEGERVMIRSVFLEFCAEVWKHLPTAETQSQSASVGQPRALEEPEMAKIRAFLVEFVHRTSLAITTFERGVNIPSSMSTEIMEVLESFKASANRENKLFWMRMEEERDYLLQLRNPQISLKKGGAITAKE
jgi:hypothetical protein